MLASALTGRSIDGSRQDTTGAAPPDYHTTSWYSCYSFLLCISQEASTPHSCTARHKAARAPSCLFYASSMSTCHDFCMTLLFIQYLQTWQTCELSCTHRYQKQFQADPAAYHRPSKDIGGYWIAKVSSYLGVGKFSDLVHHGLYKHRRLASPSSCSKSASYDALTHFIHVHIC